MATKGNGTEQQPTAPEVSVQQVAARPAVYIEVGIAGQQGKQVYEVNVARELYEQLGLALAALDPEPAPNRKARRAAAAKSGTRKGARRKAT